MHLADAAPACSSAFLRKDPHDAMFRQDCLDVSFPKPQYLALAFSYEGGRIKRKPMLSRRSSDDQCNAQRALARRLFLSGEGDQAPREIVIHDPHLSPNEKANAVQDTARQVQQPRHP